MGISWSGLKNKSQEVASERKVEMAPTERLKLRRQMAAAARKKSTTSICMEVEEEVSTGLLSFGQKEFGLENGWKGKKEAWMRQIREVQTWKQVRGPAGAVMCEIRDLGRKWPYWHTLFFSSEITIDMRIVCPKDVRKMLVQRARSAY